MPEHQQTQQSKKTNTIFQNQATPVVQTPASNPYSIIQRAKINPRSLTRADIMQLHRTIGNQAVGRLLSSIGSSSTTQQAPVQRQEKPEEEKCPSCMQRQEIPEEEEPLQGKMTETLQRQEIPEEEEPLQGKMIETVQRQEIPEEEPLQGKFENKPEIACSSCFASPIVQRQEIPEEEEPLQGKFETVQRQEIPEEEEPLQTKRENNTGMPDNLKASVESLSGIDMSNVKVHYNSEKPSEVGALAYTQGANIHVAPGQERHLPHEAWHVIQQAQGRVQPTMQVKDGIPVNNDEGLESEADVMGAKALQMMRCNWIVTSSTSRTSKSLQRRKRAMSPFPVPKLQAQPEPVQWYGGYIGVPGRHNVDVETVLIHGTGAQQFLDIHGVMKDTPDAPAWFAIESRFSAHAGSRGGRATTYLHNYQVNTPLNLLAFDDVADLSQYLQHNGFADTDVNGVDEANHILGLNPLIHGYWLSRDAVRNEEEIILFDAGIANLTAIFISELQNVEQPRLGDELDIGRKRRLIQGGQTIHVGNMMDLSDFRTIADDPRTGRRRAQSFR